jgi:AbiJ N-terminal domain 4
MLTDVFHKRYPNFWRFGDRVPQQLHVFLRQGAQIIFQDLRPQISDIEELCLKAYEKLVRELGHGIYQATTAEGICVGALSEIYDIWNNTHGEPEQFVQVRFSLLELLFSEAESEIGEALSRERPSGFSLFRKRDQSTSATNDDARKEVFHNAVRELNARLRQARIPLHYHNGLFQHSSDDLTESRVHEPFWSVVKDPKWTNVDVDIKEAIDRRDNNGRDVALYALKALESTIKIISDESGWSRGTERGAANYIDNLVSSTNGRFIEVWESEQLKALFRDLRNPHGHGPGSAALPVLSDHQEQWVIECSMIWIKALVNRM